MTTKLYCYVDESGQDTQGEMFIVSVVVDETARDKTLEICESIERATRKGRVKWIKTGYERKLKYIQRILVEPALKGKLNFAVYRNNREYVTLTILTIARAILSQNLETYKATILIDGLERSKEKWIGTELRHLHIKVRKVRGTSTDDNDALIRLADAVCGFVRMALHGNVTMQQLLEQGKRAGSIEEL